MTRRSKRGTSQRARTLARFCADMRRLLEKDAQGKGYHSVGSDGPNPLYEFVAETVGGPGHALGEIVFKTRRYAALRRPEDLAKIAAWAFLVWQHDRARPTAREGR